MNVLLGQEALGKFNNASLVYGRIQKIAAAILAQDQRHLTNLEDRNDDNTKISKTETVLANFPRMDFICMQEVFDRVHALALISMLRNDYKYFTFDIGDSSIKSNYFLLNSGLMIASRFPILSVRFHPFTWKNTFWQRCLSYGVVICKVDLGSGNVGIIANLHTMAYEDQDPLIDTALTEVRQALDQFRATEVSEKEKVKFDVICGDFNIDNLSPSDRLAAGNNLFSDYSDPAAVTTPGSDQSWAVGTEMRQLRLNTEEMQDKEEFRRILVDDVRRRHYIIDADVERQTMKLMTCPPSPNQEGRVGEVRHGGMRR